MKNSVQWGIMFVAVFFICMVGVVYGIYGSYDRVASKGSGEFVVFTIEEGADTLSVAEALKEEELIQSTWGFIWGLKRENLFGTLQAGTYEISTGLTPREIALLLSKHEAQSQEVVITFPEGWTASKMADRLTANALPGEEFLALAKYPTEQLLALHPVLADIPEGGSLEGYLFPDTYHFFPDVTAEEIVEKMLNTFEKRISFLYRGIHERQENFHEVVTLASIIEGEVRTSEDRRIVSGIFYTRLGIGMALQSDATLSYILSSGKTRHSAEELKADSPYNTYKYPGLPPGPVSNPSLDALEAAVYPEESEYLYFLSDPETGQTYFAVTFEGHKANKVKAGL